jgi:hypothetical protein
VKLLIIHAPKNNVFDLMANCLKEFGLSLKWSTKEKMIARLHHTWLSIHLTTKRT